ncbi:dihydroneopterin aldolase [Curvivirga aplysinae]|uniref:dihydroneopterin aldolase n=1 Tax=Curvivirga aplysinae TaxID=2529852 RepID=UPI0012BC6BBA|nr:dihydroneopterin aldolase [Curvivirga aplysinae]MTI10436.1 dihydroneopterin aldolase [Curvivirga aplysinae]
MSANLSTEKTYSGNDIQVVSGKQHSLVQPVNYTEENSTPIYKILVRDLDVAWNIGVFDHEYDRVQIVRINLELMAKEPADPLCDDYEQVVCYATISERIAELAREGHIQLVETLGHRIALLCLDDDRVVEATVRIEKPEALKNAHTVGIEVTRRRA